MIRMLLWLLLGWVLWRLFNNLVIGPSRKKHAPPPAQPRSPRSGTFSNVEDAEFEDITPKHKEQ